METVLPGTLAVEELRPYAADFLFQTSCRFDCPLEWSRESDQGADNPEKFVAEPFPIADDTNVFVPRTGVPIHRRLSARLWMGEHSWNFDGSNGFLQGSPKGYIKLRSRLSVRFGVIKGLPAEGLLGEESSWLCWAEEYGLGDGSTCFRLSTLAGELWLRGRENTSYQRQLLFGLKNSSGSPVSLGYKVIRLSQWSYHNVVTSLPSHTRTPWTGVGNIDATGREWCVVDDELTFDAKLYLVAGGYNDRLAKRSVHEVKEPYDIVWRQDAKMTPFLFG